MPDACATYRFSTDRESVRQRTRELRKTLPVGSLCLRRSCAAVQFEQHRLAELLREKYGTLLRISK